MKITQYIQGLRPQHWVKNGLLFLPLFFGRQLFHYPGNVDCLAGFVLFSLASGTVYLVNDIHDRELDRHHSVKRFRPVAAESLSVPKAKILTAAVFIMTVVLSYVLNALFGWVVLFYFVWNIVYTFSFRDIWILDVLSISISFALRLLAGYLLIETRVSPGLMLFTMLFAGFLALQKRRYELYLLKEEVKLHRKVLKRYTVAGIDKACRLITLFSAGAYIAYSLDPQTVATIGSNHLIYSTPFLLYGFYRYPVLAHQSENPTYLIFSDWKMIVSLLCWFGLNFAILYRIL